VFHDPLFPTAALLPLGEPAAVMAGTGVSWTQVGPNAQTMDDNTVYCDAADPAC
jgi:hypothetical protein